MNREELYEFLEEKYIHFNAPKFVESDPISIPHQFSTKEDIEIAAFLASVIAWGQRPAIIKSANIMMDLMDRAPHDFILNHTESDLSRIDNFVYRTFNSIDLKYFLTALQNIYLNHNGLEQLFTDGLNKRGSMKGAIAEARATFFELPHQSRTTKHFANTDKNSAAKRMNMYLRWMVRNDKLGVDFGLWSKIPTSKLMMPIDVHSGNVGRKLGLLTRKQSDWRAVEELTASLREFDSNDPVKYDFSLFGLGVFEKF